MQTEVTRMENAAVANVLRGEGYRYCHTNLAEAGIYYKYYQEGFHIVMAVDLSGGNRFSVQQHLTHTILHCLSSPLIHLSPATARTGCTVCVFPPRTAVSCGRFA